VLQCVRYVAVCGNASVGTNSAPYTYRVLECDAVCCVAVNRVLQCVAMCCSVFGVLQCVAKITRND